MSRARGAGAALDVSVSFPSCVVRVQVVYRPGMHYHEVAAYVAYLAKHGKGEDGGPGEHFDRHGSGVDIGAFLPRCWRSPWVFKVILSPPSDVGSTLPLQEYAQAWMLQVEHDLGCKIDWVAGAHFDTDTPHVQFLWNGRTEAGVIVKIDRSYISHGLRARASEILSLYGGY
jgi:type IV secretory pathway VirD2 relaxase